MATASASYHWGESGDMVSFEVDIENDYPDALATARAEVVRGLCELAGIAFTPVDIDPEP